MRRSARGAIKKKKNIKISLFLRYYFAPANAPVSVRAACCLLTELHKLQQ